MLLALRLSSSRAVHRGSTERRTEGETLRLRIVFKIARDDRLASRLCACPKRMDWVDAQDSESFDVECEFDDAEGGHRSGYRASGIGAGDDRRVSAAARLACARVKRDSRREVRSARGRVLCNARRERIVRRTNIGLF